MKTALISGASRGIGAATATALSKAGFNVVINYNKSAEAAELLANNLENAACFKADVSRPNEVAALAGFALERFGSIDLLVNNAGVSDISLLTDVTPEQYDYVMDINLKSAFLLCREVLPHMISKKSGSIINISSMWGQTGGSMEVVYSAAKAGIIGLTKALAKEVGPSGIRVNCIAPGVIDTDMNSELASDDISALCNETPLCKIGSREDIANAVLFLAGESASFITGQVLAVNGGIVI